MKKNKKWKLVASICLGLSSVLIMMQYVVRSYDKQEQERKWDNEALQYVTNHCLGVSTGNKKNIDVRRQELCKCYSEKIKQNHSFYEYEYYVKIEKRNQYLDSCRKTIRR